jgi:hypothetical protein
MSFAPKLSTTLLLFTVIIVLLPVQTYAFGAGDIPDFSYLNGDLVAIVYELRLIHVHLTDKAFRHGDIESILETLVKSAGRTAGGGGLLGLAHAIVSNVAGGAKFSKSDIKKVYFVSIITSYWCSLQSNYLQGNWLRDYSQVRNCVRNPFDDASGLSRFRQWISLASPS